jgi:3-phenylpropionate/trans-cinnamate dioxygenase ferredoxin component
MPRQLEIAQARVPEIDSRSLLRIEGRNIALFNVGGVLYAIDDACPHAGSSLLNGVVSGCTVQCRAHGLRFDLATGCMPGADNFGVKAYPVEITNGRASITLPADEFSC